jgi:hypothetical protein
MTLGEDRRWGRGLWQRRRVLMLERGEKTKEREVEGTALGKKRDADTGSMGIEMLGGENKKI